MVNRGWLGRAGLVSGAVLAAGLSLGALPGTADAAYQASAPAPLSLGSSISRGVVIDPATNIAYVPTIVSGTADTLYAIDLNTDEVVATIPITGELRTLAAIDPATDTIYVSTLQQGIRVIDGATDTVTGTIPLPAASMTFDSATGLLYVGLSDSVDVIDPATSGIVATITGLAGSVTGLTTNAQGTELYAASDVEEQGYVYVIDTATDAVVKSFEALAEPVAVALDGTGTALYVTNDDSSVARYDLSSGAQTGWVDGTDGNAESVVDTSTGTVYTTATAPDNIEDAYINQLNAAATAVTGQIPVPGGGWIALDQATNTLVYVTNTPHGTFVMQIPLAATGSITTGASATFTTGKAGTFAVKAAGTPAPTVTEAGKLPAGVSLSAAGTLSGTPKAGTGGTYPISITADNGLGSAVAQRFTLTVDQPAAITSANHATFTHGKHGSVTIRTSGYPTATVKESGTLPSGLKFTAGKDGTATISGTPAQSAKGKTYVLRLTATNKVGATATQRFTIKVS